jgi:hypothetical protein
MYWKWGIAIEQSGLTGPEAQNYESVVRMHLQWIEATAVGMVLLQSIARNVLNGKPANLVPFKGPIQPGYPTRGVLIQPYLMNKCNASAGGSTVSYSPYTFQNRSGPCSHHLSSILTNRGILPSEILFHELVHALRDAAGHGNRQARLGGGLTDYRNLEELIAVVVTNMFMTDPTNRYGTGVQVGMRSSHHHFTKLEVDLSDSVGFFASSANMFGMIDQFCQEDGWFTKKLADTNAAFNPLAVYYYRPQEARQKSSSLRAVVRDVWPHP